MMMVVLMIKMMIILTIHDDTNDIDVHDHYESVYDELGDNDGDNDDDDHNDNDDAGGDVQPENLSVWMMENNDGFTVLRLSVAVAVPEVFGWLLELVGVNCQMDQHDGLFDSLLYDVTEIDPVARRQWLSDNQLENDPVKAEGMSSRKGVGFCYDPDAPARSAMKMHVKKARPSEEKRAASVLELICETGRAKKAFDVLNTPVVRRIVKDKWNHYWHYVLMWGVIHLVFMVSLTCHIVFKADLISRREEQSDTFPPSQKLFVDAMAALSIMMALVLLVFDVAVVRVWRKQPYKVCITHHNGMYRIILIFMASSLILDSIWSVSWQLFCLLTA